MRTDHKAPPSEPRLKIDRKLIATASELFYRRGFQAVSVDDITTQAGVTKMSLYRYFSSKDGLAAACVAAAAKADLDLVESIADRMPDEPVNQLRAIVEVAAARISAPGYRGWPTSNIVVELTQVDHPARQAAEAFKARMRDHFLALAQAAGAPRPQALADGVLFLIEGAAIARLSQAEDAPSTCLGDAFEALLAGQGLATVRH